MIIPPEAQKYKYAKKCGVIQYGATQRLIICCGSYDRIENFHGRIIGGIYDDRLLVKPVKSAIFLMPDARFELPYEGAKEMILVDNVDDKEILTRLFHAMHEELPAPKKKK